MWGIFKKRNGHVPPALGETHNGHQAPDPRVLRRPGQCVLVPTVVGSMVVMVPRHESGTGLDWPTSIPPLE